MVKRREPRASTSRHQPTAEEVEKFASGAENSIVTPKKRKLDPSAKRDFKAIRVPFNEYEYVILDKAAPKTGRSKLNFIRWAVMQMAKDLEG
jgi:hypothetical protein